MFFDKLINIVVEESGLPRLIWDQEASKDHTWVRIPPTIPNWVYCSWLYYADLESAVREFESRHPDSLLNDLVVAESSKF